MAFMGAILVSLAVGIGGTLYVVNNYRSLKEAGMPDLSKVLPEKIVEPEGTQAQQDSVENEQEVLPPTTENTAATDGKQQAQPFVMPDLLSSDDATRQALIELSPGLETWLNTDQLIRKYVLIVNDFSQGLRIAKHMNFLRLEEPFVVNQSENGLYMSPKGFQRYNAFAQAIQAIDARTAVTVYQKFKPLMLQVFDEFSYPGDITLESVVKKAAGEIIAAPVLEEQLALVRPSVYYKFADNKLEALSPVQKQMLRMGPENMRIIQAKCREFLVELAKTGL